MSSHKILLDANFLIRALEDPSSKEHKQLTDYLERDDIVIYITPLIYYEVLRGVDWTHVENYAEFEAKLSLISSLNIDKSIADKATALFRFEKNYRHIHGETPKKPDKHNFDIMHFSAASRGEQSKKIDKHNFDIMHFSTAKVHGLKIASNDADIQAWEKLHDALIASQVN